MTNKPTLQLEVKLCAELTADEYKKVADLCSRAFEEDYEVWLRAFKDQPETTHVLGWLDDKLVTHALWVVRELQLADGTPLRTAYIEGVATGEAYRNRGYATQVMERVAVEIQMFDIGGLAPFSIEYYARLGWEVWRGPLWIRQDGEIKPTPPDEDGDEECLMILRLSKTPLLDLNGAISIEWRAGGEVW